jgi:hypothetical protein
MFVIEDSDTFQSMQSQQEAYVQALLHKWDWLLQGEEYGLKPVPSRLRRAMAIMFENQQACSRGLLGEQTKTTDIVVPEVMAMPIIRATYPRLWSTRVASVQPLPLAGGGAGKIFFLKLWREDVSPDTRLNVPDSDYALGAENSVPKRVKLTVDSMDLTAEKDILAAVWSSEVEEDARNALALNVRQVLVNGMSGEIAREHDQRILQEIYTGAATEVTWSKTVGAGYLAKEWYETLIHAIVDADMNIWNAHYRRADWLVCGKNFYSYLLKTGDFKAQRTDVDMASTGVEWMGRLEGLYDVYLSAYLGNDEGVMGRYARDVIDTGYVIAPYIPLAPMPAVYAEMETDGTLKNTDKWTQNVRTRQAKAMVQNTMFARVRLTT